MPRILLTQSQVSIVVSSAVVVIFTFLLFLSGYVVQQRSVTGLQATLKPRLPKPPASLLLRSQQDGDSKHPALSTPSRLYNGQANIQPPRPEPQVDWTRLAHVQLVRTHGDVCSAIMVLAEFHKLKSPARRILLFPRSWAESRDAEKGAIVDPYVDSSRRLMRLAARRYKVELRPVSPLFVMDKDETSEYYSLASAYALPDVDRVAVLRAPGSLIDAEPLDRVLAFADEGPFGRLDEDEARDGVQRDDLTLLRPGGDMHLGLIKRIAAEPTGFNDTVLDRVFDSSVNLTSELGGEVLVRSIGALHDAGTDFNATLWLDNVAYIRFSDPKLPGPEFDIPYSDKVAARPKNKDADWTWTKLYGQFGMKRLEICGLDLETYRG